MKITQVNVYVVDTGSYRPVVAEILTDEGLSGIGEAAVGFGVGATAAGAMIAELAERFVVGRNPDHIRDIWNDFYYHTFWGKGAGAIFYAAVSALEVALWDIQGKARNVPIYQLFGGLHREEIAVYANDWSFAMDRPAQFARRALEVVADGYNALKIYPFSIYEPIRKINGRVKNRMITGEMMERAVGIVREVRKAVGDSIDLMVDVTAEGTRSDMIRFGQRIEEFSPLYYEEPVDLFDLDSYAELKAKVNLPIATGERLYTRYGFKRLLELRAADILQPDVGTVGGFTEAYVIAQMGEVYNMRVAPHNCGGPVLTAASVQLAACTGNFYHQEIFPYRPEIHYNILENPLEMQIRDSVLQVPTEPGLGVRLNHRVVDGFRTAVVTG